MEFQKTYDKIRTRIVIRNFLIAFFIGGIIHILFSFVFGDPLILSEIIRQAFILGIVFIFLSYNMFKRSEILKNCKNLAELFPETNPLVFYGILFSGLKHTRFEDNPNKAIKRIRRNFRSLFLKLPELNPAEIKNILHHLNSN